MAQKKTIISKNPGETARFAKEYVENLLKSVDNCGKLATVVALEGDLGSGKTTFVKAVAEVLGVKKTVTSPTFVLEKVYKLPLSRSNLDNGIKKHGFTRLIHIDAYRLLNGEELRILGWKALTEDPRNIIFLEWPERAKEVLPKGVRTIRFTATDETTRVLTVTT
jgi:tRNA threonylcarbamoyladenosine biosynthesis protein TsaE